MEKDGFLKPIWLPVVVGIIVVPTMVAAVVGGPGPAIIIAVVLLFGVVVYAMRSSPKEPIEVAPPPDATHRVLLALTEPVADAASAEQILMAAEARGGRPTQILALAPTQPHFLDRWASDVGDAQAEARHKLDITVASLRREHVDAQAEVGDSDVVLAIEDALREFPADEVVLATGSVGDDPEGTAAARDLGERLRVRFEHVVTGRQGDDHRRG